MKNGGVQERKIFVYESWWNNNSPTRMRGIITGVVCGILLIIALFIYLLVSDEPALCSSSPCVRTSEELVNYIDIKMDPCEDFYRFSCGNFLKNRNFDNLSSRSVSDIMEVEIQSQIRNMLEQPEQLQDSFAFNLTKKFYRACMNQSAIELEGLDGLKQIFQQIGGWPTLNGSNWDSKLFDWKKTVHKLRQIGINFPFFFILSVQKDQVNPNKYILNLKGPSYSTTEIDTKVRKFYLNYMVDLAVLMGAPKRQAQKEQEEVIAFLIKLAKLAVDNSTTNSTYNLSELNAAFPGISWENYINHILQPANTITYDDEIIVSNPNHIQKILKLLNYTNERTIANFISWHIIQEYINYLPEKILNRAYKYLSDVKANTTIPPRWQICLSDVKNRLPSVIAEAYVEKYFNEDTRDEATSMIRNIKYQFMENVYKLNWLDEKTKNIALGKLRSSVEDIPCYNDFAEKNRFYDEVEILEDKILMSVLNLDFTNTNIQYARWKRVEDEFFFDNLESVIGLKIVYSPKRNSLRIPLGLFQGVLYQKDRPKYMNYGTLGTVIAHEIYHIIIQADYKLQGELRSWWSSHSLLNYEQKLQCLSDHYGKFITTKAGEHTNSTDIRDEDMADLAGMKVAYDAYISWVRENDLEPRLPKLNYSPNQLFWISSAIHHCAEHSDQTLQRYIANYQERPGQYRVNGALQNLNDFAMDFGCPTEMNMNPENKCRIW